MQFLASILFGVNGGREKAFCLSAANRSLKKNHSRQELAKVKKEADISAPKRDCARRLQRRQRARKQKKKKALLVRGKMWLGDAARRGESNVFRFLQARWRICAPMRERCPRRVEHYHGEELLDGGKRKGGPLIMGQFLWGARPLQRGKGHSRRLEATFPHCRVLVSPALGGKRESPRRRRGRRFLAGKKGAGSIGSYARKGRFGCL